MSNKKKKKKNCFNKCLENWWFIYAPLGKSTKNGLPLGGVLTSNPPPVYTPLVIVYN